MVRILIWRPVNLVGGRMALGVLRNTYRINISVEKFLEKVIQLLFVFVQIVNYYPNKNKKVPEANQRTIKLGQGSVRLTGNCFQVIRQYENSNGSKSISKFRSTGKQQIGYPD